MIGVCRKCHFKNISKQSWFDLWDYGQQFVQMSIVHMCAVNLKVKYKTAACSVCLFWFVTDLCFASPDKSARRGAHGAEHDAYTRRPACASQAASASEPMANDQSRDGTDTQSGPVASQSCTTSWTWSHSRHRPVTYESASGHTAEGSLLFYFEHIDSHNKLVFMHSPLWEWRQRHSVFVLYVHASVCTRAWSCTTSF